MIDDDALGGELARTWRTEIPLAAAMDLKVTACSGTSLTVQAPFRPNRNVHGTAFAGALFSVCVLTGWGVVWLALRRRALTGVIVIAESRIEYRKAVTGDIVCDCTAGPAALDDFAAALVANGRARLPLTCAIEANGKRAVTFEGTYVVHAKHDERKAHPAAAITSSEPS